MKQIGAFKSLKIALCDEWLTINERIELKQKMVFRVSMGGAECLPSGDTSARLPHKEKKIHFTYFCIDYAQ